MLRLFVRRSNDLTYFTDDPARELDGIRDGRAGWWLRGSGDTTARNDLVDVFQSTARSNVQGYDIIFAAPRPISILLAIDADRARGVVAAHRASVAIAMQYLEQHALSVRDRRGGLDVESGAKWSQILSYTHGVNRHGEPHLHDHVLVGARPDGATSVLDSRGIYAHVPAADALYRSSLRFELAQRSPWSAWRSFRGIEHVGGLDEGYQVLWGGHHDDRGTKLQWTRRDAVASWYSDRSRFVSAGALETPRHDGRSLDEHVFAGAFEGRREVARRHVVAAWANAATFGHDPVALTRAVDLLYPTLGGSWGVREPMIGVPEARMIGNVRQHGPRPIGGADFDRWIQRVREPSRSRSERSR